MPGKLKTLLTNFLLVLVTLACLYLLIEWAFLRFYTVFFTLDTVSQKFENPQGVMPVLQTSKKQFLPENYIAITGDSYAMGMGDGFYTAKDRKRLRVTSAHTIQDLTGTDVISYGVAGSGTIRGMLANPLAASTYIKNLIDDDLAKPDWMLFYFYEGNDLTENLLFHRATFETFHAGDNIDDNSVFERYIDNTVIGRDHLYLAATRAKPSEKYFFYRYLYRLYIQNIKDKKFFVRKFPDELRLPYLPEEIWVARVVENPVNKALINKQTVSLADNMQGPALELTAGELAFSISIFEKSLKLARQRADKTKLAVIYIPSVLATYQIAGDAVDAQDYFGKNRHRHPRQAVDVRSQHIRQEIRRLTEAAGIVFVDTTTELQQAAKQEALHGPKDWNHLNTRGYEVLGQAVVNGMTPYWKNQQP